ncbi:MAG: hypothetical protein HY567_04300 [Candidatus Kerfeldbacteria bacterium]|nr:hypothetical protein [Candidatus Kerfeldbacteria bacterium]
MSNGKGKKREEAPAPETTSLGAGVQAAAAATPSAPTGESKTTAGEQVGILATLSIIVGFVLGMFKAERGRVTAGKALRAAQNLIVVGWKHAVKPRGIISRTAERLYPHAVSSHVGQLRGLSGDRRRRRDRNRPHVWFLKAHVPVSTWAWPASLGTRLRRRGRP